MNRCKPLSTVIIPMVMLIAVPFMMAQEVPPELGSSIKDMRDAKAYCERILREVEAGTTILVPFQVKTTDGKTLLLDDYNLLPKEQRPRVLETLRTPVEVKDIAARLSAAKLSADDQKRAIAAMVAESKNASGEWKDRLANIERKIGLQPTQNGGAGGKQVLLHGEVVEVTADKVRITLKGKGEPQVGDAVKVTYEIEGTGIKADVAKGKVAKVEPGFATVDITNKTAEVRKGYLAEITASGTGETAKQPQPSEELDLTGEWTNEVDTGKTEPIFDVPTKNFRVEKADAGIYRVPGFDSRAPFRIVNNEPRFYSRSGAQLATGKVERDPKTGAIVRIQWSAGSTWTRKAQPAIASERDLAGEWTMIASKEKETAFGSEFTSPKTFRLEKTPQGTFVNPGSSNARIVAVKDEFQFFNNAGNRGATAVPPKTGAIDRIEWSDGSVFTRKGGSSTGQASADDLSGRWDQFGKMVLGLKRRPDGRYDVHHEEDKTFAGIGAFTGQNTFKIDWKRKDMPNEGVYEWTLNAARTQGNVRSIYIGEPKPFEDENGVKRLDGPGVVPKTKTDTAADLSGDWQATLFVGKSIWTLKRRPDGRYDARQKDFGKATGVGVFADGLLKIEWETADGYAGIEEWHINPALNAGKGRGIGVKRFKGEHEVTVVRLSTSPADLNTDLSGRWADRKNGMIIVLKRSSNIQYELAHYREKDIEPCGGGIAELRGNTLTMFFDVAAAFGNIRIKAGDVKKATGVWRLNADRTRGEGNLFVDRIKTDAEKLSVDNGLFSILDRLDSVPRPNKGDSDPNDKKIPDDKRDGVKPNEFGAKPIHLKFGNGETSYATALTRGDAKFPEDGLELSGKRYKLFLCPLQAGKIYQIDMESKNFRSHLILRDPGGFFHDRDNTRIVFKVEHSATYEIIATHLGTGIGTATATEGAFTLRVREIGLLPGFEFKKDSKDK